MEEAGGYLGPADQQERSDRVESGLAVVTSGDWLSYIERQRDDAGEREQPPRWAQHLNRSAVQGEMAGAEQQGHDGQVHRRRDERCHPHRHPQSQAEGQHIAEAKAERQRDDNSDDHGHHPDRSIRNPRTRQTLGTSVRSVG